MRTRATGRRRSQRTPVTRTFRCTSTLARDISSTACYCDYGCSYNKFAPPLRLRSCAAQRAPPPCAPRRARTTPHPALPAQHSRQRVLHNAACRCAARSGARGATLALPLHCRTHTLPCYTRAHAAASVACLPLHRFAPWPAPRTMRALPRGIPCARGVSRAARAACAAAPTPPHHSTHAGTLATRGSGAARRRIHRLPTMAACHHCLPPHTRQGGPGQTCALLPGHWSIC